MPRRDSSTARTPAADGPAQDPADAGQGPAAEVPDAALKGPVPPADPAGDGGGVASDLPDGSAENSARPRIDDFLRRVDLYQRAPEDGSDGDISRGAPPVCT